MPPHTTVRRRLDDLKSWLRRGLIGPEGAAPAIGAELVGRPKASGGARLANAADLARPDFGADFLARFADGGAALSPRKRWEMCWLAQRFAELLPDGTGDVLGLGVGHEPLIYHFAHLARRVVATDLFSLNTAWLEARLAIEDVYARAPFDYPRERLTVANADMRRLDFPAESFDAVWSCSSVEHVRTLGQFVQIFREVHRVLKPGGVALITTEFSLGEPYYLPGVLSLWPGCTLLSGPLGGLTREGPVDTDHRASVLGNQPAARKDIHRMTLLREAGSAGVCIHVGYTRLAPVAFALRKTSPVFDWPENLGASEWYEPFAAGLELFDERRPAEAVPHFHRAVGLADTGGARLHSLRFLLEAQIHAGDSAGVVGTLDACERLQSHLPADDDALDLIAYVAAGVSRLGLARRCWEKAFHAPGALCASRLRIRCNQLEAELSGQGCGDEARHLSRLADAAWCEAVDFHGETDPQVVGLGARLKSLRERAGLSSLLAPTR